MKISIVIPTRNRPKFLRKTLKYLSKNNFFFTEVIIVDSSDNPLSIKYENYPEIQNKIKIFNSAPSISIQRNIGLRKLIKILYM